MALPFDKLQILYNRVMKHDVVDQIELRSPLFERMMSKRKMEGGSGVEFPIRYARNNNLTTPAPYQDNPFTVPKHPTGGTEPYVWFTQMIGYSKQENARSQATPKDLKMLINYLAEKVEQAQDSLEYYLTAALFGDGTDFEMEDTGFIVSPFNGLAQIIDDGNTVHGIAQGDYSWWQAGSLQEQSSPTYANITDSTNANYILDLLAILTDDTSHNGKMIDLVVMPKLIMRACKDVVDDDVQYNKMDDAPKGASLSWTSLNYEGVDMIADELCTDGNVFGVNTNHLYVAGNPEAWFEMTEFTKKGDAYIADIDVDMCVYANSLRHQGKITGLPSTR